MKISEKGASMLWTLFAMVLGIVTACHAGPVPGTWGEDARSGFGGELRGVTLSQEQGGLTLASSGNNLLTDPGFEAVPPTCPQMEDPYGQKPRLPRGWEHNGLGDKTGALHPAPSCHSGVGAWELVDTVKAGEPALLQYLAFKPEYRGKTFIFSVWARTPEGTHAQAMIALKFKGKTHWRCDVSRSLVVGPEWKAYSITAFVPEDADELGVVIGPSSFEGQGAIWVDDASLTEIEYVKRGVYVSEPYDMGSEGSQVWRSACRATMPDGTGASVLLRTGNTPTPDAAWSAWEKIDTNPDVSLISPKGRYVQYRVELSSARADCTPVVNAVQLHYGAHLGFVAGKVTHARTGAPVAGALVKLNRTSVVSRASGEYLLGVPAGEASGTVTALHYLAALLPTRAVREGERTQADIKLQPDPSWPTFRGGAQRQGFSALSGRLEGFGVVWQYPLGTAGSGQIVPADLDGDGRSEFVLAQGGSLSARRLNGDLMWQVDAWEIGSIMGVYDLLGNGEKQVIGLSAGWQPYANGAFTVVSGRDGKVLSRVDTWPDAGDIGHGDTKDYLHGSFSPLQAASCVVADLDRDGKQEILVHPNYHSTLMAFHFHDGLTAPKMMWKTQKRFKYDLYLYPLLSADVDGDGWPEIVFHDNDLIRIFDGRTGDEKSAADMGCPQGLFGTMACADVEGNGTAEVVLIPAYKPVYTRNTVALAGWNGKALVKRWSRDFEQPVETRKFAEPLRSPFADVDGDGRLEIIVQVGPDVVILKGEDGTEKWRIAGATLREAADLNGNGAAEIIVNKGEQKLVYSGSPRSNELERGKGGFGPKDIGYPADWGWRDAGNGGLFKLRGASGGRTEVVNQKGEVKGVLPGAPYRTSPVVADLDGDGQMEVLVRDAGGVIRVLRVGKTVPFPELKCDLPGEASRGGGITVCDLDGDGKAELIFCQEGRLVVANCDGIVRFKSVQGGLHFPVVGEFDGDGVKDIACYSERRWTAYSGKDGKVIWEQEAPESNEVATWDVDGDGRTEIAGKMGPVFLLNGADGKTRWTSFRREQCALGLGTFADLNGDGLMEILISGEYTNTAWYADGKAMWWPGWSSGGAKEHYGAVADVNGDGAWDVAMSSNHGVLYCWDGRDGRQLWAFSIPEKVSLSHCAAADLDGDGRPEFVFGSNTGKLFVLNGEDGSLAKMVDFGHPVGEPIVADVDGDGQADVLVVSNGTLLCLSGGRRR